MFTSPLEKRKHPDVCTGEIPEHFPVVHRAGPAPSLGQWAGASSSTESQLTGEHKPLSAEQVQALKAKADDHSFSAALGKAPVEKNLAYFTYSYLVSKFAEMKFDLPNNGKDLCGPDICKKLKITNPDDITCEAYIHGIGHLAGTVLYTERRGKVHSAALAD